MMKHNFELVKKRANYICSLLVIFSFSTAVFSQASEEKPRYAPGKIKHRNKTDEIGRKQGTWMFFNTFGEKISEIDFVNNRKEGTASLSIHTSSFVKRKTLCLKWFPTVIHVRISGKT